MCRTVGNNYRQVGKKRFTPREVKQQGMEMLGVLVVFALVLFTLLAEAK
jgi:hypothetical protein